jgi:hypothetical protein
MRAAPISRDGTVSRGIDRHGRSRACAGRIYAHTRGGQWARGVIKKRTSPTDHVHRARHYELMPELSFPF